MSEHIVTQSSDLIEISEAQLKRVREYREKTDIFILEAEDYYNQYKKAVLETFGTWEAVPRYDLAKLSELCCQIAKARSLRTNW